MRSHLTRNTLSRAVLLLALYILLPYAALKAQPPTTAAAYPFVAYAGTFNPISGGTQWPGAIGDDATQQGIPIGFSFPFTTGNYTTVSACSNGWLSLNNSGSTSLGNTTGGLSTIGGPVLMPLWDDLHTNYGGQVSSITTGSAPNRVFTIEWKGVTWTYWVTSGAPVVNVISFQIKLYESGVIEYIYSQGPDPIQTNSTPGATIGIAASPTDYKVLNNSTASPTPTSTTFIDNINIKPATGQVYLWGQIPCNGVPTTSVTGASEACPNKQYTLSLAGLSTYSGLTFQWQESLDNATWTNFTGTGATSISITDVMTGPKYYRCIVTCTNSNLSYTTAGKLVSIAPFYYCYCDNSRANSVQGMDIGNVKVISYTGGDTLVNNGIASPFENNAMSTRLYTDFRYDVSVIPMYRDSSYRLLASQINSGSYTKGLAAVYIDYDRNGTFDTYERVLLDTIQNALPTPGFVTDTFLMPNNAAIGFTGMRVIMQSNLSEPAPCGIYSEGETEDYLVDIRYHPCDGPANAGTVTGEDTSMCEGYTYTLYDTTHEYQKHNINWSWEMSPDGVVWVNAPNSLMKDSISRVFTNTIYYRMRMICANTWDTTWSAPFRIGLKPAYKCYCYSQSTGGNTDTSDIGAFELNGYSVMSGGPHQFNQFAHRRRQDYTDLQPLQLFADRKYGIFIYHTMSGETHKDAKITLFIDYNNNHKYDIPEERINTWFTPVTNYYITDSIYMPDDVIVDVPTGMRVILNNNISPNVPSDEACGEYTSGETEDFIVIFRKPWPVSVRNINNDHRFTVYPNPTEGKSMLRFDGKSANNISVTVTDITGRQVMKQLFTNTDARFTTSVDLVSQPKGIYMVELNADGERFIQKLVVQ